MNRFLLLLAIATFGLPPISTAEWYSIRGTGKPDKTIHSEDSGKTVDLPLYRLDLQVTKVAIRRDTERPDYYWLEATLKEQRDSGDGYFLAFDDTVLGEIYTRDNKWVIGFSSVEVARRCFYHLCKLHRLDGSGRLMTSEETALSRLLAKVVIHRVDLKGASIAEALDLLTRECERTQIANLNVPFANVKFVLTPAAALSKSTITLDLQNVPGFAALRYFTEDSKTSFSFTEPSLVVVDLEK